MSFKDRLANLKVEDVKSMVKDGVDKAKEIEAKAEQSEAGGKAKKGFAQLRDSAKNRFGK